MGMRCQQVGEGPHEVPLTLHGRQAAEGCHHQILRLYAEVGAHHGGIGADIIEGLKVDAAVHDHPLRGGSHSETQVVIMSAAVRATRR